MTTDDRIRALAVEVASGLDNARIPDALRELFRREGDRLSAADKRAIRDAVHDTVRSRAKLDFLLDRLAGRPFEDDRRPAARLVLRDLLLGRLDGGAVARRLGLSEPITPAAIERAESAIAAISDPVERLAISESLPRAVAARLTAEQGEARAWALARALGSSAPMCVRTNRLILTPGELIERLLLEGVVAQPAAFATDGVIVRSEVDVYSLDSFKLGLMEIQDEGSQLISELVAPPPRGVVLDACAGAGGKTLHLATLLGGRGKVVAVDTPEAAPKLFELRRRARRAGLSNVEPIEQPGEGSLVDRLSALTGRVDRVLVDAPCSGVGVLRRKPDLRWRITEDALERLPRLQAKILDRFAPLVAPGGRLIYSTCTLLAAENDEVVGAFLARHPEMSLVAAKEILGSARATQIGDGIVLRVDPERHGTDGFFAAVFRRARSEPG